MRYQLKWAGHLVSSMGIVLFLISCQTDNPVDKKLAVIGLDRTSGTVDSELIISGTGFSDELSEILVFFGDFEASVLASSPTQVLVSVPNGSTKELIRVSVNGQYARETPEFTTLDFMDMRDGIRYPLAYIGEQVWLGINLNFDTPADDACYNFEEALCDTDGRFYRWEIAQEICPAGWKVPGRLDYEELLETIGYNNSALSVGGVSGFNIIRTGTYYKDYPFNARGEFTNIWTSTLDESDINPVAFTWPQGSTDFFVMLRKEDHACLRCLKE